MYPSNAALAFSNTSMNLPGQFAMRSCWPGCFFWEYMPHYKAAHGERNLVCIHGGAVFSVPARRLWLVRGLQNGICFAPSEAGTSRTPRVPFAANLLHNLLRNEFATDPQRLARHGQDNCTS